MKEYACFMLEIKNTDSMVSIPCHSIAAKESTRIMQSPLQVCSVFLPDAEFAILPCLGIYLFR